MKDLEFGVCLEWGGDEVCLEDEEDADVKARRKWEEDRRSGVGFGPAVPMAVVTSGGPGKKTPRAQPNGVANGIAVNGNHTSNGHVKAKSEDLAMENGYGTGGDGDGGDEVTQPLPIETLDSLTFKLTLLEMYGQRVEKRKEAKFVIFDRGLLEYKKVCAMRLPLLGA